MKRLLLTLTGVSAMMTALMAQPVDLSVCASKGYTLNSTAAAPPFGATSYTWYEDGEPLPDSNSASYTIPAGTRAPGTYAYWRMASNEDCPTGVPSNTYTVRVSALPAATVTAKTVCSGGTVTLSATLGAGTTTAMTYTWNIRGTSSTTSANSKTSQALTAATTYTVQLINSYGCVGAVSAPASITVSPAPSPPTMAGSSSYCNSGTITATAGNGGTGIRWDNGSTVTLRTVNTTGANIYRAVTTSAAGCTSSTATITVTVRQGAAAGYAPDAMCGCAEGLASCGGTCQASAVAEWTACSHTGFTYVSAVSYECGTRMDWSTANKYCNDKGMRLPTASQLQCICNNKTTVPGGNITSWYWTVETGASRNVLVNFASLACDTGTADPSFTSHVKCVK